MPKLTLGQQLLTQYGIYVFMLQVIAERVEQGLAPTVWTSKTPWRKQWNALRQSWQNSNSTSQPIRLRSMPCNS